MCLTGLQNGILNIWNFFIAIGAGFAVDRVGRRKLFITSTIGVCHSMLLLRLSLTIWLGMFVWWTCQTICFALVQERNNTQAAHGVIAFICLYKLFAYGGNSADDRLLVLFYAFYDLAFTPLIVSYTVEILPYPIR